jgi:membrane complex biogenesis BtpA family protein
MALAAHAVRQAVDLPIGINVLRNDAAAALGIATVTGAAFVRVNIHTGVIATDQGLIEGRADETMRLRTRLGVAVQVWADVQVKHGSPLGTQSIEDAAEDAAVRGLADALIVTGTATGKPADLDELRRVRRVLPEIPIFVGSGVSPDSVAPSLPDASGFIVGTWAKRNGRVENPVDPDRVRQLADAVARARR